MARKVFISFLGTNNYVQCRYDINGVVSEPVRFVQEALIEYWCKDWTEQDRILIFCTSKETTGESGSKEINWLDNGQPRVTEESEKIGLQHRLQDLQARIGLKAQIEEAKEMIELQVNKINYELTLAYKKLEQAQGNLSVAEENMKLADESFKSGMCSSSDLMAAQTAWLSAQSEILDAEIEIEMNSLYLKQALGKK